MNTSNQQVDSESPNTLVNQLGQLLQHRRWWLTTAESCTGGAIAQALTAVPGCSNWFGLGWVTYSNQAKISQLGVRASTLERYGAVSQQTVHAMAQGALKVAEADLSIAVSGIAGPGGGTPDKPVGTVHFAWATVHEVVTQQLHLTGDRQHIRQQAVIAGLLGALRQL